MAKDTSAKFENVISSISLVLLSSHSARSRSDSSWLGARWSKARSQPLSTFERVAALDDGDGDGFEPSYDTIQMDDNTAYQAGGTRISREQRARRAPRRI